METVSDGELWTLIGGKDVLTLGEIDHLNFEHGEFVPAEFVALPAQRCEAP